MGYSVPPVIGPKFAGSIPGRGPCYSPGRVAKLSHHTLAFEIATSMPCANTNVSSVEGIILDVCIMRCT